MDSSSQLANKTRLCIPRFLMYFAGTCRHRIFPCFNSARYKILQVVMLPIETQIFIFRPVLENGDNTIAVNDRFVRMKSIDPRFANNKRLQCFLERNAVFLCKGVVALIVRIREDGSRTVVAKYEIRDPNGNFLTRCEIDGLHPLQFDARFFLDRKSTRLNS